MKKTVILKAEDIARYNVGKHNIHVVTQGENGEEVVTPYDTKATVVERVQTALHYRCIADDYRPDFPMNEYFEISKDGDLIQVTGARYSPSVLDFRDAQCYTQLIEYIRSMVRNDTISEINAGKKSFSNTAIIAEIRKAFRTTDIIDDTAYIPKCCARYLREGLTAAKNGDITVTKEAKVGYLLYDVVKVVKNDLMISVR